MEFIVIDYSDEVLEAMEDAVIKGLTECGMAAERYAKKLCAYDTGLLRNSTTYALGGQAPAITSYKADKSDETGAYEGTAPEDEEGKHTVYLGTNVEYAQNVELGIGQDAQPFIEPAVANYVSRYKSILKEALQGK